MPLPPAPAFDPAASPDSIVTSGNAQFTVLTSRLVRLEYSREGYFEDRPSQAFWFRKQPVPDFRKSVSDRMIEIETADLILRYRPTRFGFTRWTLSITLKSNGVTWRYGNSSRRAGNLKGTAAHPRRRLRKYPS